MGELGRETGCAWARRRGVRGEYHNGRSETGLAALCAMHDLPLVYIKIHYPESYLTLNRQRKSENRFSTGRLDVQLRPATAVPMTPNAQARLAACSFRGPYVDLNLATRSLCAVWW